MKKLAAYLLSALLTVGIFSGCGQPNQPQPAESPSSSVQNAKISFTDDDGREIALEKPCERIISLYSAHTENLYSLGAGDRIIGAQDTSTYPPEAAFLDHYDYDADPEKIIAADPDCVLIRPFITRKVPDFVKALENAGLTVVSLYPETFEDFDGYIEKLAMLTGTEDTAKERLAQFHADLNAITEKTAGIAEKQTVFFESTEVNLRTVTPDSMPGLAIKMAGGENAAQDAEPISPGSSIAAFGAERILALADEIDVYVSQRGAMNAGGDLHSITIRPGFDTVRAVKDSRVYVINEKLISSPAFRYAKGVRELARYLYPEQMDSLEQYQADTPATKRDLANLLVRAAHLPVYVPSSSKYYTQEHTGHIYGLFEDVTWQDQDFDFIETAAVTGAVGWEADGEKQYFRPDAPVTREMLAKAVFILYEFEAKDQHIAIGDLDRCEKPRIVQTLVDNGVFPLIDGRFEPDKVMSCREVAETLAELTPFTEQTAAA